MKIGLFTATYLDTKLDEVCTMAAGLGYQAVELPAFAAWAVLIIRCVPNAIFSSFVPLQMASVSLP